MENAQIAGGSDHLTLSNIFAVVNIFSLPVYPHPDVEPGVGPVRDLEDHGARQQVQRHRGDLRHVPVTWARGHVGTRATANYRVDVVVIER